MWSEHAIKLSLHAAKEPTHKAAGNINCGESHEGEKCVQLNKKNGVRPQSAPEG